jgi:microcin C transport system substrate-binding protein
MRQNRRMPFRTSALLASALAVACTDQTAQQIHDAAGIATSSVGIASPRTAIPHLEAADRSVSAEQGGSGFTGRGWDTSPAVERIGDRSARKGGVIRFHIADFPSTLRLFGPESNTDFNDTIRPLIWESLLRLHPGTGTWMPGLATHWQVSADRRTFRFRLDPNARFSDGRPVTARDVVATWKLLVDKGLQDPAAHVLYARFNEPVAESTYIVRVSNPHPSWRDFILFAGDMPILPAHLLESVDAATYLSRFNFTSLPGSGPYRLDAADVHKGQRLTLRRRRDYWAGADERNDGLNNFDEIHAVVVRDPNLAIEMFKKGDLDYLVVNSSRQWAQDLDIEQVRQGLIQKRKIFTNAPIGVQGLAFNTRRAPWNDVRVREALARLLNRELMIEKFFFKEYVPQNSYFAGGPYENRDNPKTTYDPARALALLGDAGWRDHDANGRLVRNGRPLVVELLYSQKTSEPYLTVFQEDLRKAGVTLTLRLVTPETLFRLINDRQFDLASTAWSADRFPVPQTLFGSALADRANTNNITGFKSAKVDRLIAEYESEFDSDRRAAIVREIDAIVARDFQYILQWNMPFRRIAYWNRFGHPPSYLTRTGTAADLLFLWWHDAPTASRLEAAKRDGLALAAGAVEVRPWQ